MIVVLGRPGLTADGGIDRLAGNIALAVAGDGGRVELVGSVGDDSDGDSVIVLLGQAGIGHAAILRDPAGITPRGGALGEAAPNLPRLDAGDIDLGLRYLADVGVIVVAEPLPDDAIRVVNEASSYHGAALIVLTAGKTTADVPDDATVLEIPADGGGAFAALVARYAASLDSGRVPADAWRDAVDQTGWEQAE